MVVRTRALYVPVCKAQGAPVPQTSSEDVGHTSSLSQHLQGEHLCLTEFRVSQLDSVCSV